MTVLKGFVITVTSGVAFAVAGTGLGYSIGKYAPGYYRLGFGTPADVEFDPIHAGIGLGATQGLATGIIAGLVIVVAVAWYNLRLEQNHE